MSNLSMRNDNLKVQQSTTTSNQMKSVKEKEDDSMSWKAPLAPPPSPVEHTEHILFEEQHFGTAVAMQSQVEEPENIAKTIQNDASQIQRESLADSLSSSLANIAREEGVLKAQQNSPGGLSSIPGRIRDQNSGNNALLRGSVERSSSSSSSDNQQHRNGESSGEGPAVVTANTTSSGDDRYSSGQSGANASNQSSSNQGSNATQNVDNNHNGTNAGPFLRHSQRRPVRDRTQARDGYGLPVHLEDRHLDERLDRRNGNGSAAHAVVVARLPPPQTETGSSSFFSSSSDRGSGGEEQRNIENKQTGPLQTGLAGLIQSTPATADRASAPVPQSQNKKRKNSDTDSSQSSKGQNDSKPRALVLEKGPSHSAPVTKKISGRRRTLSVNNGASSCDSLGSSADSGSGTEGGYAGSASSNIHQSSCSSPSVSSSEGGAADNVPKPIQRKREFTTPHHHSTAAESKKAKAKRSSHLECQSSSSLADFSSGVSGGGAADNSFAINISSGSCSPVSSTFSASSHGDGSSDDGEEGRRKMAHLQDKHSSRRDKHKDLSTTEVSSAKLKKRSRKSSDYSSPTKHVKHHARRSGSDPMRAFSTKVGRATGRSSQEAQFKHCYRLTGAVAARPRKKAEGKSTVVAIAEPTNLLDGKAPIFSLGCDTMAHCLTFLEPLEIHALLTMPISNEWRETFTMPQDLWRVLCLSEPFNSKFDGEEVDSSDDSVCSFPVNSNLNIKHLFGKYRMLYTSFVRCMRYLARIKDDAVHGRAPSVIDYGGAGVSELPFARNSSLKNFLAQAKGVMKINRTGSDSPLSSSSGSRPDPSSNAVVSNVARMEVPAGVSDKDVRSVHKKRKVSSQKKATKRTKYGHSQITQRLLGPAKGGGQELANVDLPWSCAIYSIVNWMVAFSDVEGIQTMCLRVLPFLLEDETQRTTAQRAGLTGIVLRGMVLFPDSVQLHTAAFHTIVLLARPLGGREGMLFHSSMVNSSGIFNNGHQGGKNGIAVMLDSMRRFASEEPLQAMSCWSLVNIALAPSQKAVLVKLGGISATANAMMQHPYSAEVQFRALFALINLVIPSVNLSEETSEQRSMQEQLGEVNDATEREMLDENVGQIANLVVLAMKNFCSSQTILNRACLVLHNLSLTQDYHETLLWTPNCYQMLEWCLANYPSDQVLQQCAAGTLHRLQMTLASDDSLRLRFTAAIQAQQQLSLEEAHREATLLHDQHQQRVGEEDQRPLS
eukprot:CAMPEP_0195282086 /NCGR_PEP_ID=MMETSP0707-20130614/1118_1 /TAXON_ID=33640 /ORGANISM="Asterionellopsis glacialis, Strain CCMP134" /LENGTH=1227 /DNA_ID=CAMNT_0040341037 /DNA_START=17 /DNA_END=3700 /DNA_ORIENTATION=-